MHDREVGSPWANMGVFFGMILGGFVWGGEGVLVGGFGGMFLGLLFDLFTGQNNIQPASLEESQESVSSSPVSQNPE